MRRIALALLMLTAAACRTPGGTDGFIVSDIADRTYAAPGTSLLSATIKGKLMQPFGRKRTLTVAAVDPTQTLASTVATGDTYQLALPDPTSSETTKPFDRMINKDDNGVESYGVFDRWEMVVFVDRNGNGTFDRAGVPANEVDIALASIQKYRLIFKGYDKADVPFLFLPYNDFEQGWILCRIYSHRQRTYHQDFNDSVDFELTN